MSRKIRILMVHSSDSLYGADVVALELARRLDRAEFEVLVVLPNDIPFEGDLARELAKAGIAYRVLKLGVIRRHYFNPRRFPIFLWYLVTSTLRLVRLIQRERIDVVHSTTLAVLGGALASGLTRRPHIWQAQEILTRPRPLMPALARLADWLSTAVVPVSPQVAEHIIATYPRLRPKVKVIPNGIDTERFRPDVEASQLRAEWGFGPADVVVGVVGRIHIGKGHSVFLDAARLVADRAPAARFLIVGGPSPGRQWMVTELREQAARLGLAEQTVFSDFRRDIPAVMGALDIFVLPSTYPESFGLVALEAMAAGRPVVATAHGGPLGVVEAPLTGLLVPPGEAQPLAEAITGLVLDQARRERMGRAARERVVAHFSIERSTEQFATLYRSIAHGAYDR